MLKRIMTLTLGASILLGGGAAMAAAPAHAEKTESGAVYHGAEYTRRDGKLARTDNWSSVAAVGTLSSAIPGDGWEYVGGETGWTLIQHSFDFRKGALAHADSIPHDTPKPSLAIFPRSELTARE